MAKLNGEIEVKVGDDGLIALRNPTNKEWNDFEAARYPLSRNKIKNHALEARAELFDRVVVRIENIEDDQGPITLETRDRIPNRIKSSIIFRTFETDEEIDVKN
jgi:hypothetical protein